MTVPVGRAEPEWVRHAIFWQVFPLGACGAPDVRVDGDPVVHRLRRLIPWLDYAVELGASGIALGPVFQAFSHGYDTIDHTRIDPRLGDDEDFEDFVRACHDRGLRVILDGVFNHVGRDHPAFRRVVEHGPGSAEEHFFRHSWLPGSGPGTTPDYVTFEGHAGLVQLDHDNPAVADLVVDVMCRWLAAGADGWRLDAAYATPTAFWASVLPRVRERFPQAYVVGEVIHGDYAGIVADSGMDAVTQYELWKAIWSSLNDENFFELDWTMSRHNDLLASFVPLTFVGNHDVTRLASTLRDPRLIAHALLVLMTVGGTPTIYYGDEQGYRGVKEERLGGDAEIRPPLPDAPADLAAVGTPTLELHRRLLGLRRRHPWLHTAHTSPLHVANGQLVYETAAGDERLVVAVNSSQKAATVPIGGATTLIEGAGELQGTRLALPAYGWAVLA